jgi:XRE family transcriptional regulator, fatty acid utilization regulator
MSEGQVRGVSAGQVRSMSAGQVRRRGARAGVAVVPAEVPAEEDFGADGSAGIDLGLVGAQIRAYRNTRNLTLGDVANCVGCSPSHLSQIERGRRAPSLELLSSLAEVLTVSVSKFLNPQPPNRRVAFELAIERGQAHPAFRALGLAPLGRSRRIPTLVLEHLATLHQQLQDASHLVAPILLDEARIAHMRLWRELQARNNYLGWIEDAASAAIAATSHAADEAVGYAELLDLATHLGYRVRYRNDLPLSVENLVDRRHRVIYLPEGHYEPTSKLGRLDFARALAPIVLEHPPPASMSDNLRYRLESSYFATSILMPQRATLKILHKAKSERALSVLALQEHFVVPYRTAALRMTNLATEHLGLRVHYVASDDDNRVLSAYENDGIPLPRDKNGATEGQRLCRYWAARQPSAAQDDEFGYCQYTDTPTGTFWCVSRAVTDGARLARVTFGARYDDARWFLGSETRNRLISHCPDANCCIRPEPELSQPWVNAINIRVHHRDHPTIPPGGGMYVSVDLTGVLLFLEKCTEEDRRSGALPSPASRLVVRRSVRPAV